MNLYSSPYAQIAMQKDRSLLIFSWRPESKTLEPNEVKQEILKMLDYIEPYSVTNVIVDSSDYPFLDHEEIQAWINYGFMAKIVESRVKKYGFVMRELGKKYENLNSEAQEDDLKVTYFITLEDAYKWIDS